MTKALDALAWEPDRGPAGVRYWAAKGEWGKCAEIGPPAVEPLIALMPSDGAARALGKIGDARAVETLVAAVGDEGAAIRRDAARALGPIGDERGVEPLVAALADQSWDVRAAAAASLGEIGDARAFEPLVAALADQVWEVRKEAAEALVAAYRSERLSDAQRAFLLARRADITSDHADARHSDYTCGYHSERHDDSGGGIGVAFPD